MLNNTDVRSLVERLDMTQWICHPNFSAVKNLPVLTRQELQTLPMAGLFHTRTSGSTGEPVTVWKTYNDAVWFTALFIRELSWRKWDMSRNICVVNAKTVTRDDPNWCLSTALYPQQGKRYNHKMADPSVLQSWLEAKNPHYIIMYPSVLAQLDLSKLTNLIDVKNTGEIGSSAYSSEECGYIALQCPDNKEVYHVMENVLVEREEDGQALVTSLTNPYIKRYRIGDYVEFGKCHCGRALQTISKIHGRVRNMITYPDGTKEWPTVGSPFYYERFQIKRFQAIQKTLEKLTLRINRNTIFTDDEHAEFVKFVQDSVHHPFDIEVEYVKTFEPGKFEEFKSLL